MQKWDPRASDVAASLPSEGAQACLGAARRLARAFRSTREG
jgi:hypothetical protein